MSHDKLIDQPSHRSTLIHVIVVVTLLAIQASLLGYAAAVHSPTHLEPAFVASGISHWRTGGFELYRVNPPLPRMLATLPLLFINTQTDWKSFYDSPGARPEFGVGEDFVQANGPNTLHMIMLARWACIPLNLLGAFFAYKWSCELYGRSAGLATLVLFVFDPNLLAYGELVTPDSAFVAFGILAGYTFWRWLQQPTWWRTLLAGTALGLAELSKLSWLILFPLFAVLWVAWRLWPPNGELPTASTSADHRPTILKFSGIILLAVHLLNSGYAYDGFGTPLQNFDFVSVPWNENKPPGKAGNSFRSTCIGSLPIPLPRQYVIGLDCQRKDLQHFSGRSYLHGEWKEGGWWYYYLYACLVKEPCSTLILAAIALMTLYCTRLGRNELPLVATALTLFIATSACTEFSIHFRYVLPSIGLLHIFIGRVFFLLPSQKSICILLSILICLSATESLSTYPHQLCFFNRVSGGPPNGHRHLIGSSLEWGQDLTFLATRIRKLKVNGRVIVALPRRYDPDCLSLFPENVEFDHSLAPESFPADALVIRSRSLFPSIESTDSVDLGVLGTTWSVHRASRER